MERKRLRFSLALAAISLTSCADYKGYCPPVVRADQETKEWLMAQELPPPVLNYLDRIGKQQEAIETVCK